MTAKELFKLELGDYELTDKNDNYKYSMVVGVFDDKRRYYRIIVKGSFGTESVFLIEDYEKDEFDKKHKIICASGGVGGIRIRTTNTFWMLNELKLIKP